MREIPLSKGMVALVSDEDYDRVAQFKWYASLESRGTKWYAIRKVTVDGKRVKIRMHRFIMGLPPGKEDPRVVDHDNDNGLDNQRHNLKITDQVKNMDKSKGWKGSSAWKALKGGEDVIQSSTVVDSELHTDNIVGTDDAGILRPSAETASGNDAA